MQIPTEGVQIKQPHQMSIPHFQFVFCDLLGSLNAVDMGSADLIITHGFTQNVTWHCQMPYRSLSALTEFLSNSCEFQQKSSIKLV